MALDLSKYESREVELGEEEIGKYWNPEKVGDSIAGNIYEFKEETFDNRKSLRINLYRNIALDKEEEEAIMTLLPGHAHLKRRYADLEVGDFINVIVTEITEKENKKGDKYNIIKYDVKKYPALKVNW